MENQKVRKVFRSRISVLIIGILLAVLIPCTILMIKYMIIPGLYIMGGTIVFIVFSLTGFRYVISGDKLYLKVWFISMGSANIAHIISVERTYNPISSPAASLKKLCISFKRGVKYSNWLTWQSAPNWLVSPVREQEFAEELKSINPDIYVRISDKKEIWRIQDWDI